MQLPARGNEDQGAAEGGYTMIELMVVVLIVGILAAIAIPSLARQRERGYRAQVQTALESGASALHGWAADAKANPSPGSFLLPAGASDLSALEPGSSSSQGLNYAQNVTISVVRADEDGFCLQAEHPNLPAGETWFVDDGSAPSPGECP